jgi:hypothetical protein
VLNISDCSLCVLRAVFVRSACGFAMNSIAAKALICATATFGLAVAALFAFVGAPASADGAAEALGRLFALVTIAAILTHWMAKKSVQPWSWPKFSLIYLATEFVLLVLMAQGHAHAAALCSSTVE